MGIDTRHPDYTARQGQWQRTTDCYEGSDAVKERKETYLPKLSGMDQKEYDAYVTRALFFGAMMRTVQGLVGALVRKEPDVEVPSQMKDWLDSITNTGLSLTELVKAVGTSILLTNRCGLLVDRPEEEEGRPYIALYDALSITNWLSTPRRIVLMEPYNESKPGDPYVQTRAMQYRELRLDQGVYTQAIWRKPASTAPSPNPNAKQEYVISREITPTRRGEQLSDIPFVFLTAQGVSEAIEKAPLLDMADVNLSHFSNSADLEHGRHFTALPTPWVSGLKPDTGELRIGSGTAWLLPDPQSRAGYLEFSGTGLGTISAGMKDKEEMMAVLGARLLMQQRTQVETAETARIHQSGDMSAMSGLAVAIERGVQRALEVMATWEGFSGKVSVKINRDFIDTMLDAPSLTALLSTWQAGGISLDTFLWNLKQGELLPPDTEIEDERARIESQNQPPAAELPPGRGRSKVPAA